MTSRTKKIFIWLIVLGLIVGAWAAWYVFFKPHRDVSAEKPAFVVTAESLKQEFAAGDALGKYIEKAILIEGTVSEVGDNNISLDGVVCNFEPEAKAEFANVQVGQSVKVQGRVSTYNDLMEEIVVDKCTLK